MFLFLALGLAGSVGAATIDPGLQEAFLNKTSGDLVRVVLLMEDHADLAPVEASLGKSADPWARREAVVAVLKDHAAQAHAPALAVLAEAERAGMVRRVRQLWLANAVAFEGTREAVEALAALDIRATLVHDKPYDMISGVTAPREAQDGSPVAGSLSRANAWSVEWIDAHLVWAAGFTGAGVVVAHYDTGVWLTHPDLVNRLWVNPGEIPANGTDDDGNGYIDDVNGWDFADQDSNPNDDVSGGAYNHGTHTAGTVCGDGTNGTTTGVAPGASVMVCKSYLSDGSGAPFTAIYEGQQYAIDMGARVFTMSLGIGGDIPPSLMRTERNLGNNIRAAGVIFFNSAGNDHYAYSPPLEIGVTARVPAPWNPISGTPYSSLGGVMAVGGTGYYNDIVYGSSSRGPVNWGDVAPWYDWPYPPGLTKPDVAAPGVNVNSLMKPSGYSGDTWSGTSMSCPHAAGLAALMLEKNPSLSPAGIDSLMEQNAVDLGTPGKDVTFGSGRIDALATVNAVPYTLRPHLVQTDMTILDATGDGIIDPGESFDLVFELTNNSPVVNATGVTGGLAVATNPYVTVTDGSASFGTIPLGGGTGDNSGNLFSLTAAGGAPQGYVFTLFLTVYAQNGYQKTFDLDLFVGLPEFRDHNVGAVLGTVTDQGIIGFLTSDQTSGSGFGPIDGNNGLFIGSLWGGTGMYYLCNNDYGGGDAAEWIVLTSPNGRVNELDGMSDQTFQAKWDDSGHSSSQPVIVTQTSFAWADPPYDDFIILQYKVRNDGTSALADYHLGVFCDFDVDDYGTNEGGTDATHDLSYLRNSTDDNYFGITLLGSTPLKNITVIHNPTYVYPNQYIEDSMKGRHLKGLISTPTTSGPDDWSILTSSGGFDISAGDSITVSFALVWGTSLAEIQDASDNAEVALLMTPASEPLPVMPFGLAQNRPNPFNPRTTISFNVERAGHAELTVYDLSGRRVKTLASQSYPVGEHSVVWDGTNDAGARMPSGMYVYKIVCGDQIMSKKMMLIK